MLSVCLTANQVQPEPFAVAAIITDKIMARIQISIQ